MAVATVKLWDVQQARLARPLTKFFWFNDQEFRDWKANNGVTVFLGTDINQTSEGQIVYTKAWEERVPNSLRYDLRVHTAVTDENDNQGYPPQFQSTWYQHVNGTPLPADTADQDWQTTLDDVLKTWDTPANYMIRKQAAGITMIEAQDAFMNRSLEAVGLPF